MSRSDHNLSPHLPVYGSEDDLRTRRCGRWRAALTTGRYVEFVDQTRSTLLGYAWLLTADPYAAEDLLQETYVRVYVKWRRVKDGHPLAYARTVMSNLHTDRWRKGRRDVVTDQVPETAYLHDPRTTDLVRALQQLAPRERECVVLRHYYDLTERDTAATLGISVGAVKRYTSAPGPAARPCGRPGTAGGRRG